MPTPTRVAAYVDVRYTTRQPTGVDKHIARMVHGLAACNGFDISVVAPQSQLTSDGSLPRSSSLAGLPVRALPMTNMQARTLWAVSPWPPIDRFCPGANWIYSPQELWAPAKTARTAVTIHGATYFERAYPGYHSTWARFERARMSWFFSQICRHADLVISVSAYLENFLIDRFGLDPRRSLVVGNGVDACFFAAGDAETTAYDPDRILVVGGLNDWDGAAHVLAAADVIRDVFPSMTIDIVGTFDDARYVAAADARPNIRRLGYVEPEKLAVLMPGYLALLYLPNVESFGLVALEAMAAGLPVLAGRRTAVPETVGAAALSIEYDAPETTVAAIQRLRTHGTERALWISRGRSRASGFTWQSAVDRLSASLEMN